MKNKPSSFVTSYAHGAMPAAAAAAAAASSSSSRWSMIFQIADQIDFLK